jgi:hypothetical protein
VAVGQGVLGKKETLDSVLQATMTRIWSLLAIMVLSGVIIGFGWLAASGLSVALVTAPRPVGDGTPPNGPRSC